MTCCGYKQFSDNGLLVGFFLLLFDPFTLTLLPSYYLMFIHIFRRRKCVYVRLYVYFVETI